MKMHDFTDFFLISWTFASYFLFTLGWVSYPLLIIAAGHRLVQRRDPKFDLRPSAPTHAALYGICAAAYGVLLPAFYFPTIRLHDDLIWWHFGPYANNPITIVIGAACTIWMAGKLIFAMNAGQALRFGGRLDRIMAGLGLALFLWLGFWLLAGSPQSYWNFPRGRGFFEELIPILMGLIYPSSFFLGAIFVYRIALTEARRLPAECIPPRARAIRCFCAALAFTLTFSPWLLSMPRVGHEQALNLIRANREDISDIARRSDLDPCLLAGIIYVAQTRERPRWTGEILGQISMQSYRYDSFAQSPSFNTPIGLCGITPTKYTSICSRLESKISSGSSIDLESWFRTRPAIRDLKYNFVNTTNYSRRYYYYNNPTSLLSDSSRNLTLAAVMVHLIRTQWRQAGHPIDNQPEILATLYHLGFEKSFPKSDPQPNDYGRRVKDFMESAECKALFPKAGRS